MLAFVALFCVAYVAFSCYCSPKSCSKITYCVNFGSKSCFYYQERSDQMDYYFYIIPLVKELMNSNDYKYNFILGQDFNYRHFTPDKNNYDVKNGLPLLRLGYSYEHTLVRPGEQYSDNTQVGNVPVTYMNRTIENYLVRLEKSYFSQVDSFDIVFEYSLGNIINIQTSNMSKYDSYMKKMVYISPTSTYYNHQPNYYFNKENRKYVSISTFISLNGRRSNLIDKINKEKLEHVNMNGLKFQQLLDLYKISKILINIHQTDI